MHLIKEVVIRMIKVIRRIRKIITSRKNSYVEILTNRRKNNFLINIEMILRSIDVKIG